MAFDPSAAFRIIDQVRQRAPLVHNITNYVVMNNTANALLAAGASPVMAHAEEEVADMVAIAQALVINIGTLSSPWVVGMQAAIQAAEKRGTPWVLDPVGVGATPFRRRQIGLLLDTGAPAVLRANASELMAIDNHERSTRGVDSSDTSDDALAAARRLQESYAQVVCVSGETDYIMAPQRTARVMNGHPLMARITGMGCTATALIGACLGVHEDPFEATVAAMALLGVAGQRAAQSASGPGSLQVGLLDQLYRLDETAFLDLVQMEISE